MRNLRATSVGIAMIAVGLCIFAPPAAAEPLMLIQTDSLIHGFDGAREPVLSPDGRHLYVAEHGSNQVEVRRVGVDRLDAFAGNVVTDGVNADGLEAPGVPAFDPNGRHLYVPAQDGDGVSVFARDGVTGALSYVEVQRNGFAGVAGLVDPTHAAVSPDGRHVYVAGAAAVVVFTRDAADGSLTYASKFDLPTSNDDTNALAMSTSGRLHVGTDDGHIYVLSRNATTGALALLDTETGGAGGVPAFDSCIDFERSPDGRFLYATTTSQLMTFSIDAGGSLSYVSGQTVGGGTSRIAISRDGRRVFASYFSLGGYVGYVLSAGVRDPATGVLSGFVGSLFLQQSSDDAYLTLSRNDELIFVNDTVNDDVYVVAVAPLEFREQQADGVAGVDGLGGARAVAVSDESVYVAGYDDDAIATFERDPSTGSVSYLEVDRDGVGNVDGLNGVSDLALSPDGRNLYAAGFLDDAVAVFDFNTQGGLQFLQVQKDGVDDFEGLASANAIAVSGDSKHVYVAGYADDAISVLARNPISGLLTFVEIEQDGVGGVDGLGGVSDLIVSPDGAHLYAVAYDESKIATFARNATTGALSFLGPAASFSLGQPTAVAIDPKGRNVYVANRSGDSITVYDRTAATGALGYVGSIDPVQAPRGLAMSPSGNHLIAASDGGSRLVAFRRNPDGGAITIVQAEFGSSYTGLAGAWGVAISPDGLDTYVAGTTNDTLTVFTPEPAAAATSAAALLAIAGLSRRRVRSLD